METIKTLLKHMDKDQAAKLLDISVRYIDLILEGKKKPSKRILKLAKIFIVAYEN